MKFPKSLPRAFTEHGALMAANVLNSQRAVQMSIFIVRAFLRMRAELATSAVILKRLAAIDKKLIMHDVVLRAASWIFPLQSFLGATRSAPCSVQARDRFPCEALGTRVYLLAPLRAAPSLESSLFHFKSRLRRAASAFIPTTADLLNLRS